MGREVRRVPANWQHPVNALGHKQPMYSASYGERLQQWNAEKAEWDRGVRPDYWTEGEDTNDFIEWSGEAPDPDYFAPWCREDATWFQLWETVSEGTPVSPPFATPEELISYLADHGDEWDQTRCWDRRTCELFGMTYGKPGWGRARAEAFVKAGWAPSMAIIDGAILDSSKIPEYLASEASSGA